MYKRIADFSLTILYIMHLISSHLFLLFLFFVANCAAQKPICFGVNSGATPLNNSLTETTSLANCNCPTDKDYYKTIKNNICACSTATTYHDGEKCKFLNVVGLADKVSINHHIARLITCHTIVRCQSRMRKCSDAQYKVRWNNSVGQMRAS